MGILNLAAKLTPRATLTERDAIRLAFESGCALGTVKRWARGEKVTHRTQTTLLKLADKHSIRVLA
jgi:hypothetical protein